MHTTKMTSGLSRKTSTFLMLLEQLNNRCECGHMQSENVVFSQTLNTSKSNIWGSMDGNCNGESETLHL